MPTIFCHLVTSVLVIIVYPTMNGLAKNKYCHVSLTSVSQISLFPIKHLVCLTFSLFASMFVNWCSFVPHFRLAWFVSQSLSWMFWAVKQLVGFCKTSGSLCFFDAFIHSLRPSCGSNWLHIFFYKCMCINYFPFSCATLNQMEFHNPVLSFQCRIRMCIFLTNRTRFTFRKKW